MATNPRLLLFSEFLCCCLLWYILIFHIFPLTWYIFFAYYVCKLLEKLVYRVKYNAVPFGSIDALWLRDTPTNRIIINALLITVGDIDMAIFKDMLLKKMRLEDDGPLNPYIRAKKRIIKGFFHCYWIDNEDFSISNHVKLWPELVSTREELRKIVSQECTREFDMNISPWEYILISFIDDDKMLKTALLVRLHHCIADGISLGHFLTNELSDSAVTTVPLRKFSERRRAFMKFKGIFWGPYFLVNMLTLQRDNSVLHGADLNGTKAITWSGPIDLSIIKDIKNQTQSTINDVLVSVLSGTLIEFFRKRNITVDQDIKVSIPIDLRSNMSEAAVKFQNKMTVVPFQLATKLQHPLLQLYETIKRTNELKTSGEPFFLGIALEIMTRVVPSVILDPLNRFLCQKTTGVLSNVPGPQNNITICGRPLETLTFWAPQRDSIGISFSFGTYADQLVFGVQSDTAILQNPAEICDEFEKKLMELKGLVEDVNHNSDCITIVNPQAK